MAKRDVNADKFPRKFGKYHLLAPLAQGGMGALYLAVTGDRGLEKLLVIKTVLPHLADKEYIARFRDEAKVVVRLSHGNLIPVFDAGQVDGELFMAMDFVEGKDLRAVWNRCARKGVAFPVDVAAFITKELCRGLGYAHRFEDINLVHRDISPPNVLMSYAGEVKLTDFGLASSTLKLEKTAPGIIYGKVAYMSPEQARGDTLDGRSDLYAAGIILWELLTGRQLFPPGSDQPKDLVSRAQNPGVTAPSKRAPRVPAALDKICVKALAGDRDSRYGSGEEFRDALGGWLAAEAPGTDAAKVEKFLHRLFAEDIVTERQERASLLVQTRERIETLPPTHELRQMLEESEGHPSGRRWGRRASDRGEVRQDRRGEPGHQTAKGVAVDVPPPGPAGRTVVNATDGSAGHALAQSEPDESPHQSQLVGTILDGRYRIVELIGEGGMGLVYLAEHIDIGKRFAVKVLHQVYSRMPDLVERFRREARAASRIGHPNIVDVTDSGLTADGSAYFVMEYLDGLELANVIDREGALDINRSLRIVTQICRALAAAHAAGIIHRDLKPENIYLTVREGSSDFVKVLDFGIAKSTEAEEARVKRLTHPGMAMGTPEYMSPEQAAGKPADQRCDVYAVGAILYEMLTGVPPYSGANFMEILTKKATLDPDPPRNMRSEIPEIVESLVMQSMSRSPDDRPPSMEALEYELTKCLSGRGAAVAKILGMRGLASRSAPMQPSPSTPPPERIKTPQPEPRGMGTATTELSPALGSPTTNQIAVDNEFNESTYRGRVPDVRSSTLGLLGWSVLGLLILGAVVVVLYVATSERGAAAPSGTSPATAGEPDAGPGTTPVETKPKGAEKKRRTPKKVDKPPKQTPIAKTTTTPATEGVTEKKAADAPPPPRRVAPGSPSSKAAAQALLKEARGFAKGSRWHRAEEIYRRVAGGKYLRGRALTGLAEMSFQMKKFSHAARQAKLAMGKGGGIAARRILARSQYNLQQYGAAIKQFELILIKRPNDREALKSIEKAKRALGR